MSTNQGKSKQTLLGSATIIVVKAIATMKDRPLQRQELRRMKESCHAIFTRNSRTVPRKRINEWKNMLDDAERSRAEEFRLVSDRRNFIVARGIAREIVAETTETPPADVRFAAGNNGRPFPQVAARFAGSINWAHSGDMVVVAFASQGTVGIDVEYLRTDPALLDDVIPALAALEQDWIRAASGDERWRRFFETWTRKEAILKASGDGLFQPLDSFSVVKISGFAAEVPAADDGLPWQCAALHRDDHILAWAWRGNVAAPRWQLGNWP